MSRGGELGIVVQRGRELKQPSHVTISDRESTISRESVSGEKRKGKEKNKNKKI